MSFTIDRSPHTFSEPPFKIVNGRKQICPESTVIGPLKEIGGNILKYQVVPDSETLFKKQWVILSKITGEIIEGLDFKLLTSTQNDQEIFSESEINQFRNMISNNTYNISRMNNSVYCNGKIRGGLKNWSVKGKKAEKTASTPKTAPSPKREVKASQPDALQQSTFTKLHSGKKHIDNSSIPREPEKVEDKRSSTVVEARAILDNDKNRDDYFKDALNAVGGFKAKLAENDNAAFYQEFTDYAASKDKEICTRIFHALTKLMEDNAATTEPIDPDLQDAICDTLMHTKPEHFSSDDLVKLLKKLEARLENVHMQDEEKLTSVLTTLSKILDVMVDANIEGLSYNDMHSKLYKKFEQIENNETFSIYTRTTASRSREALLRLKHDSSDLKIGMSRLFSFTKGIAHVYHGVTDIKPEEFEAALKNFKEAWPRQGKANDWYVAIRYIETLVKTGKYENIGDEIAFVLSKLDKDHYQFFTFALISTLSETVLFGNIARTSALKALKHLYNYHKDEADGPYSMLTAKFNEENKKELRIEIISLFAEFASPFTDDREVRQEAREHLIDVISSGAHKDVLKDAGMGDWTTKTVKELPLVRSRNLLQRSSVLINYIKDLEMDTSKLIEAIRLLETDNEHNSDLINHLAKFIYPSAIDDKGNIVDLEKTFNNHIKSGDETLVIQGETGAGKSFLALWWYYLGWSLKQGPDDPLSAYMPFEAYDESNANPLADSYQSIKGSRTQSEKITSDPALSHLMNVDSLDECRTKLPNVYQVTKFEKLGNRSRIAAFLRDQSIDLNLPLNKALFYKTVNGKIVESPVKIITLLKWNRTNIEQAIEKYIQAPDALAKTKVVQEDGVIVYPYKDWDNKKIYLKYIESIAGLEKMMYNPLMCAKVLQILPRKVEDHIAREKLEKQKFLAANPSATYVEKPINLTQLTIYRDCMKELHIRQGYKVLQAKGISWTGGTDLYDEWENYDTQLAAKKYWEKDSVVTHTPELAFYDEEVDAATVKKNKYRAFFVNNPSRAFPIDIIRGGSFLQRVKKRQNEYEFLDITWEYYFVFSSMYKNISNEAKNKIFYQREEITHPTLLNFLVQAYHEDATSEFRLKIDELTKSADKDNIGVKNAKKIKDIAEGKQELPKEALMQGIGKPIRSNSIELAVK